MTQTQFAQGMQMISSFFGSSWPNESLAEAYKQISIEAVEALAATHKRVVVEFPPRPLPPISRITAIVQQEGQKIRANQGKEVESEWQKRKKEHEESAKQFFGGEKSAKLAAMSIKLISRVLDGDFTREQTIEGMLYMESQFPGIGWKEEAAALANHFRLQEGV